MAKEIERKFLVTGDGYRAEATAVRHMRQGYVSRRPGGTVRVRVADGRGYLTVKGINTGAVRSEWEYEVPAADAESMLAEVCEGAVLAKRRYVVPAGGGLRWEVDEFEAPARVAGLVVAEIELPAPDAAFERPAWLGKEVTGRAEYYNSNLDAQA
ncbi:MAG: CYTH domain-containing protein [Bacteroides sp.]|nr:CYTH domain-containing protein [Bacteroides sp.]MCM1095472.1 CYTH domain-containing protein [Terasakiella sp.]